jgi:Ras-related protein Rab-1A
MKIYNSNKNLLNSYIEVDNNLNIKKNIIPKKIIHPLKNTKEHGYNSFKIILLGDSTVGKSTFSNRFFKNEFETNFISTFGIQESSKNIKIYENIYKIQLWDTAGQERFRSIPQKYFEKADGIILIYDITNEETFDNIISWVNDIKKSRNENVIIYLIGNKVDLVEERKISNESGKKIAIDQNMKFIEISAKWDLNISDVVYNLVFDIYTLNFIRDNDFINIKNQDYNSNKSSCCY